MPLDPLAGSTLRPRVTVSRSHCPPTTLSTPLWLRPAKYVEVLCRSTITVLPLYVFRKPFQDRTHFRPLFIVVFLEKIMTCHKPSYKSTPSPDHKDTPQQRKNAANPYSGISKSTHVLGEGGGGNSLPLKGGVK